MSEVLFENINNFKTCMSTLIEDEGLLNKRNYVLHNNFKNLNYEELNNNNNIELIGHKPNSETYCFIYIVNNTSFLSKSYKTKSDNNINNIEDSIYKLYKIKKNKIIDVNLIIILTNSTLKINNYILEKKILDKITIDNIQIFTYTSLLFNITKHSKIPKHIRVISDKDEIKSICELRNISSTDKLPKILMSDPLANFYGLQVGELFEFKKYNKNSGIYIYYRVCV